MAIVILTAPGKPDIPTCDVHLMGPCPCRRCNGTGYHHGFGEGGHDPDWCTVCGGDGCDAEVRADCKPEAP